MSSILYHFNPTCEMAVANGESSYMPPQILQQFETELACLPLYYAAEGDIVLVAETLDSLFCEKLQKIGFSVPQFVEYGKLNDIASVDALSPWGWSLYEHKLFRTVKPRCSPLYKVSEMFTWKPEHRELYNRSTSLILLKNVVAQGYSLFIDELQIGEICYDVQQLQTLWNRWGRVVVKTPFSSSGRGVFMLKNSGDFAHKIAKALSDFGYVLVEPFFEKLHDFSIQFEIINGDVYYRGVSHFVIGDGGKYSGQLIGHHLFAENIQSFFDSSAKSEFVEILHRELKKSFYAQHYEGWLGVDCMLVNQNGLKIHPVVEVNCRTTMGRLAMNVGKCVHPQSIAEMCISHSPKGFISNETFVMRDGFLAHGTVDLIPIRKTNNFSVQLHITQNF